jgi:glucan phosphoethanolaminetransferase (alkaline phosphatase superfamily)
MVLHPNEFPITIQAFEITNNKEFFVAEQIVNSQQEVEAFSSAYAGKVIKAKALTANEKTTTTTTTSEKHKSRGSGWTIFFVILIILIILLLVAYYTGWLERTTGINL